MSMVQKIKQRLSNVVQAAADSMDYRPKYIIVHHSAANAPAPQFEAINEWHQKRAFAKSKLGFFVGYHRVIERDGTVKVARDDLERDCDAQGHNYDSLSVCLVGNFDSGMPTPEQIASLGTLLSEWTHRYSIPAKEIYGHKHFSATSCPGACLSENWAALIYLRYEVERLTALVADAKKGKLH